MGAELARKRRGQKTQTSMSEEQLRDFASKPNRKRKRKHQMPKKNASGFY